MDPQTQASFIPKKPLVSSAVPASSHSFGVFWILALLLFVGSLAAAGAAFGYQTYLQNAIQSEQDSLTRAQAAYDPSVIADILRLDSRIGQAQTLLAGHISPSALFTFLEANTLTNVRFTAFEYGLNPDGTGVLSLSGEALDFPSVALQSDAFGQSKMLKNILFTNINVDPTTGHIVFKVTGSIDPSSILYKNTFTAATSATTATAQPSSASVMLPASTPSGSGSSTTGQTSGGVANTLQPATPL